MGNVLSREKQEQVIVLGRLGWSLRRIEYATGVRRETASDYLRSSGIVIRSPGSWGEKSLAKAATLVFTGSGSSKPAIEVITGSCGPQPANNAKPATSVITDSLPSGAAPAHDGQRTASASEPYRELIALELERGRNAMGIWQDLVDGHGFTGGYQSVRRFVQGLRQAGSPDARVIIETRPGEECQVDYGTGPMVRDPDSGKYRRTRLFVLTLGYSRKSVRLLVFRSSSRVWAELHEKAFRRLGGTTRIVVLDNLREGVLAPDIYDPGLNPLYRDVLAHYGVTALPCKVRDPDRKGKVESGVGHAQKTPLKGKKFESLAATSLSPSAKAAPTDLPFLPTIFSPGVISGPANDASPAFSPDGKVVYFTRGGAIMMSHLRRGHWTKPKIASFSGKWRDCEPAMAPDGSFLIFASSRLI
jgi:transposase